MSAKKPSAASAKTSGPESEPEAKSDALSAGDGAGTTAGSVPEDKGAKPFFDPSAAAKIRWDRDRERKAREAEEDAVARSGEVVVIRTTVETGAVINRLARDAKAGNVQAARELRAYLSEVQVESDTDVSALDRKTRQRVMGRLLSEIEAEDALATGSPS